MINLKDCTFIIPLKVEHEDRYRNAKIVLGFLNYHFKTNVYIYEICEDNKSKLDFIDDLTNLTIKHWKSPDEGVFHRTKYLNIMLDEVTTSVVANYDIDVIIPASFYPECQRIITEGISDVIYPYKFGENGQRRVLEGFNYDGFIESGYDTSYIDTNGPRSDYHSEYGHCIFFNTEIYKKHGAENEDFISYGPEDKERGDRFARMGFKVNWVGNCIIYHFEHYRGADSGTTNPYFDHNWAVYRNIESLRGIDLIEHYNNIGYNKKYKTIGNE